MEVFKLENFKKDFPNHEIDFKEIDKVLIDSILKNLCLSINKNDDLKELIKMFEDKKYIIDYNLEEKNNFKELFLAHVINSEDFVYTYNLNYDLLYYFNKDDLLNYFDYIWYPSSDEYIIFDKSCTWLIWVSHNGISRIKFDY